MTEKESINIESPKIKEVKAFLTKIEKRSPFDAILVEKFKNNTNAKDWDLNDEEIAADSFAQRSCWPGYYILPRIILRRIMGDGKNEEDNTELFVYSGVFADSRDPSVEGQPKVKINSKGFDIKLTATSNSIIGNLYEQAWLESQREYLKWLKNFLS
ncbi:hypothetical protein MUP35_03355 [Patescibacteria group bacterium]|nr:hypothetical protein [Patescibacteria group bacterium]